MQTTITTRHCDVSDALRERAITVVERLGNLASQQTVELRLHVARGEILIAKGEAADHRTALDRAEDKLRRQVERVSDRRRSRPTQPNHPL